MTAPTTPPALAAWRVSLDEAMRPGTVRQVLAKKALRAHYQPIVELRSGQVMGHESLIRGPMNTTLANPDALFAAARGEGLTTALEKACLVEGLRGWSQSGGERRLFVNLSANVLLQLLQQMRLAGIMEALRAASIEASSLVIEITEHEQVSDLPQLVADAASLRAQGLRFALDDFGDGRSSLRLWAELRPEFVKIDKYFIHDLHNQAVKVQTVKGLTRLAETFGTALVAEGIEDEAELLVLRDLGIAYGQGYLLGRPQAEPAVEVPLRVQQVIAGSQIAVLPELTRSAGADLSAGRLAIPVRTVDPSVSNDAVAAIFNLDASLRALAILDGGRPIGLLNRQSFVDRYARPYFKELHGRKPCTLFANSTPLILDRHAGLDAMTAVLTSSDQRYLTDGFIVTEGGRYLGLGTGENLVRVVTEVRIEAARHANPLTFLPGNIPISEHITRLLSGGGDFVACYADLNHFKPFNDYYGYWRGDEMIRLVAKTLVTHCEPRRDFIGHVGGDDFVVLFQSNDWIDRCERIVATFNELARTLYDEQAQAAGGIEAEDRDGVPRFFPFSKLAIGAVPVAPGAYLRPEQVASAAAAAKHKAKTQQLGLAIENSRPAQ